MTSAAPKAKSSSSSPATARGSRARGPTHGWGSDRPPPAVSVAPKSAHVRDAGVTKACRPTIGRVAEKQIAENRRARHDYHFLDRVEAGLVLNGSEVKSLRQGHAVLQRAYADARNGELWLVGRRGGKTYRLGDPIEVRVRDIRRAEGKVELELTRDR